MARLLVGDNADLHSMECYDPSAGTGTLLMALSHQIGEERCTIFSQDISQRSNKMLKLNLLLNGLVSSLDNAIQGDTLVSLIIKAMTGSSCASLISWLAILLSRWTSRTLARR